jgi:hypothetical protein
LPSCEKISNRLFLVQVIEIDLFAIKVTNTKLI